MGNETRITNFLLYLFLIAMSISPAFALDVDNKNLLLIAVMALSPIIIIRYLEFNRNDLILIIFLIIIIVFTLLHHPQSMRWTTVIYTMLFCMTFMAYSRLLYSSNTTVSTYLVVLKWLIYAYAIVLFIQQFCVLTGLPIFNLGNYDPAQPWKLNSLTSEPSHSARFIGILMYSYLTATEILSQKKYNFKNNFHQDKYVWIAFFWTMTTMVSATAFLFLFIVMAKFVNIRNMVFIVLFSVIMLFIANSLKIKQFERMTKTVVATLSLDPKKIIIADHSGSYRIVPIIIAAQQIDLTTPDGWMGKGIDYMGTILYKKIPGTPKGYSNGGMMVIGAEYGIIAFCLFLVFTLRVCIRKKELATFLFWLMLVFALSLNMQMLWCTVLLLYTNKYFLETNQEKLCLNTN